MSHPVLVMSRPVSSLTEDQHSEWRRQTLLLPSLHLRRRHREHPARLQRLPRHHPEDAPPPVRALVIGGGGKKKTPRVKPIGDQLALSSTRQPINPAPLSS